ncbi:FAD-binding oxidoreductase [Salinibacterium sp. G-O1]|uniref:NAD(P)/FAD-dependent oxidoreductase n=1 Tax=Salinibacterium sp. G-O1 TaxID=3046208 RepID=UPI0024BB3697|nr:FAD-binding oxidoreductase [Salinibacterium sp. G-O1]MDJ0336419.1 FAD-binding oxidoreductase [Salinibacterium sp. G-O1]
MSIPPTAYSRRRQHPVEQLREALRDASTTPFWLDSADRPDALPALAGDAVADLVVVGGGYCGLWTALIAKERDPARDVVLIEAAELGWAASGRNGGFCEYSLTHGPENGERHFPDELDVLDRLAHENFADLKATIARYSMDVEFEETGVLMVATEPHQIDYLREVADESPAATFYEGDAIPVRSPLYRAAVAETAGYGYVHPAKLVWELRRVCLELGVRIFEKSPVRSLSRDGDGVGVVTKDGAVRTAQVALATNGFPSLLARTRLLTMPIYDYAIMTEPLSREQLESIGWVDRHGINDSSREFHYYRRSADDRILFGGFDAIYHRGGKIRPRQDQRPETFELLADHFFSTFPQLKGIRFTHKWGGMIDMSTQLVAFHGLAWGGRVAYSAGFTGLGVAATRFGAETMLDLLSGETTDRTELSWAKSHPFPIPPEPVRYPAIQLMRKAVAASDENGGKDGLLIRIADKFGIGFDS